MSHPRKSISFGKNFLQNAARLMARNNRARPVGPRLLAERSGIRNAAGTVLDLVFAPHAFAPPGNEAVGWRVSDITGAIETFRTLTFVGYDIVDVGISPSVAPGETIMRFTVAPAFTAAQKVRVRYDGTGLLYFPDVTPPLGSHNSDPNNKKSDAAGAMFGAEIVNNNSTV